MIQFVTAATTPEYRASADRLKASLRRFFPNSAFDVVEHAMFPSTANPWLTVVREKPAYMRMAFRTDSHALVWLDADCEVVAHPSLLVDLDRSRCNDVALPRRPSGEWMTGVVFVTKSKMGMSFLRDWSAEIEAHPGQRDGEAVQAVANNPCFRIRPLPPGYDWIPGMSDREHPPDTPKVILHRGGTIAAPGREEVRK